MRSEDFDFRLSAASFHATLFASSMLTDKLFYQFRYYVVLNASYDENRNDNSVIYPADNDVIHKDLSASEVTQLLCREGRVPQWIDIAVAYSSNEHTYLSLVCCGRYQHDETQLYYYERGSQPFGIKSPNLPLNYITNDLFKLPSASEFHHQTSQFFYKTTLLCS
jgi:hypothetical protein